MITVFTTGGSIDKAYSLASSDFEVAEPAIEWILREANVGCAYRIVPLFRKDSLEITDADRNLIRQQVASQSSDARIVITHGSDTMVQTAEALGDVGGRVVVLTGSMQPAAFRESDAAVNVGLALAAVQERSAGVYIAMSGQVFRAAACRKNHATARYEATTGTG